MVNIQTNSSERTSHETTPSFWTCHPVGQVLRAELYPTWNPHETPRGETPVFWAWHPFGRGIGAGIVTMAFTNFAFRSGFIYGSVSGLTNLALRPIYKKIDEQTTSPEAKALNYIFSSTLPWAASAGIMHQAYKATGHSFFRLNPFVALGTAAAVEFFAYANRGLLKDKKTRVEAS